MGHYLYETCTPTIIRFLFYTLDRNFHNQIIKHTELILDSRHVQRGTSKKYQKIVTPVSMDTTTDPMEANRIALRKMFKAIAEYGREVRLRRLANGGAPTQETPDKLAPKRETQPARRRKPRRKKGST